MRRSWFLEGSPTLSYPRPLLGLTELSLDWVTLLRTPSSDSPVSPSRPSPTPRSSQRLNTFRTSFPVGTALLRSPVLPAPRISSSVPSATAVPPVSPSFVRPRKPVPNSGITPMSLLSGRRRPSWLPRPRRLLPNPPSRRFTHNPSLSLPELSV
ncbi:hypothetical protein RSAG8_00255, partial [Rhizoctonia solani AG-8 WAC10335]